MRLDAVAGEVPPLVSFLGYGNQETGCDDRAQHMMQTVLDGLRSRT